MRRVLIIGGAALAVVLAGTAAFCWWTLREPSLQIARSRSPDIDLHSNRVQKAAERADHLLAEIEQTCAENHLRFVGSTHFVPTWAQFNPDFMSHPGQILTSVAIGSNDQEFKLREDNGRLSTYENRVFEKLPETQALFDPPDQPTWSKEQAIAVAAKFLPLFADPKDTRFGAPTADYDHTGAVLSKETKSGTKTYLGSWYVQWTRVDSRGHPFRGDGVRIVFHEGFGPSGVGINLSTPYQEYPSEPIAPSKAVADAYETLAGHWYQFGAGKYADWPVRYTLLMIVLPQIKGVYSESGLPATADAGRLAWEITLENPDLSESSSSPFRFIYIWIDAHTGTFLGNDTM